MELKLINATGAAAGTVDASAELFGREYNEALVTFDNTRKTFTFGDSNSIDDLAVLEDTRDADLLLEEAVGEFDFVGS